MSSISQNTRLGNIHGSIGVPVGQGGRTSNSARNHSLGGFFTTIHHFIDRYDMLLNNLPIVGPYIRDIDLSTEYLGKYLDAIENHQLDRLVTPLANVGGIIPTNLGPGPAIAPAIRSIASLRTLGSQQPSVSVDAPRGFIASA